VKTEAEENWGSVLRTFCCKPSGWEPVWLQTPWSRGQYTYATNGHVIHRIPRQAEVPENADAVKCDHLFPPLDGLTWLPLPALQPPPLVECDYCEGADKDCDECNGTGIIMPIVRVTVGNADFQQAYLAMLGQFPDCQIAVTGPKAPAVIRFDGGEGLLMPLCP